MPGQEFYEKIPARAPSARSLDEDFCIHFHDSRKLLSMIAAIYVGENMNLVKNSVIRVFHKIFLSFFISLYILAISQFWASMIL